MQDRERESACDSAEPEPLVELQAVPSPGPGTATAMTTNTRMTLVDRLGSWIVRWGFGRDSYRVAPGLYAVGNPNAASPVFVSANYKLSFGP